MPYKLISVDMEWREVQQLDEMVINFLQIAVANTQLIITMLRIRGMHDKNLRALRKTLAFGSCH